MHCLSAGARRATIASLSLLALAAPSAALAHGTAADAPSDHAQSDSVTVDSRTEAIDTRATQQAAAADAAAAAAPAGTEGTLGSWGEPKNWPLVGIHVALMPNGKVLAFDSMGDEPVEEYSVADNYRSRYTIWDPATETFTGTIEQPLWSNTGFNIFCAGLGHLRDGTVFLAGGNRSPQFDGIRETHTFTPTGPTAGLWALGEDMQTERWYPTVTPMPNGEQLIMAGQPVGTVDTPEVRQTDGRIRQLTGARRTPYVSPREEYPWTDVGPDGRAFVSGPDAAMRSLDARGTGSWDVSVGTRPDGDRGAGSHAMYDVGKVLLSGGARPAVQTASVVDITDGRNPKVSATGSMGTKRRQHNLTVLADGSVLATGGLSSGEEQVDVPNAVYEAELWNPATGSWRTLDGMQIPRLYHSTALLLPDGRVLSAGGGVCYVCKQRGYAAKNAEVFSPPYLFKKDGSGQLAPRPQIAAAPSTVTYDAPLEIASPQAASIRKVALIRLGAVTHSVNMSQRYVPLSHTVQGDTVTAAAPANANIAPPGPYMLVVVDADGVPSVARMVTVSTDGAPKVGLTAPPADAGTAPATVTLAASASASVGAIARVEFFAGATKLGEDTSAPYTHTWSGIPAGTHTVTARATDARGASSRTAPASFTVAPGSTPPPPDPGPVPPVPPPVLPPQPPVVIEPPLPKPPVDPRARVVLPSSVTIRGTSVPVKVSCARACRGTLRLETLSSRLRGRVAFSLTRAGTKTLRVPVSASTRRLARRTPQRLRAVMTVQAGTKRFTARRTFTLRVR